MPITPKKGRVLTLVFLIFSISLCAYSKEQSRTQPPPIDSLLPNANYPGPIIGAADDAPLSPLTAKLWESSSLLEHARIRVYGWADPSYNLSTSSQSNIPLAYDIVPNRPVLDQFVLRAERVPDSAQTQHMDFGFRLSNILGIDYRYTIAQGVFSGQLYSHNNLYGDDPIEFWGQLYFPSVAQGMLLTFGRYLSPTAIESEFAPYSTFLSHSISLTYNAFTQTGLNAAIRLNPQYNVLIGLHAGDDMTPWSAGAQPTFQFLLRWVSLDNNDSLAGGVMSVNDGQFRGNHDNLQQFNLSWVHRFDETFIFAAEGYYIYQFNAALGGSCVFGPPKSFNSVKYDGCGPIIPGLSNSVGITGLFQKQIASKNLVGLRFDFFNDPQGQRIGFPTPYVNLTAGMTHLFSPEWRVRGEVRYDTAFKATPYDNGTKKHQTTFGLDTIVSF